MRIFNPHLISKYNNSKIPDNGIINIAFIGCFYSHLDGELQSKSDLSVFFWLFFVFVIDNEKAHFPSPWVTSSFTYMFFQL